MNATLTPTAIQAQYYAAWRAAVRATDAAPRHDRAKERNAEAIAFAAYQAAIQRNHEALDAIISAERAKLA